MNLAPTAETLARLQRRHQDAVPYENLAIVLGRPDSTDPGQTLSRIAAGGNARYCFHHNGAFEVVLRALGFAVQRRSGQVWGRTDPPLNHLALLVIIDGRRWWPDLGLGNGFRDPVEVVTGEIRQGPFKYQVTDAGPEAWSFRHAPGVGGFAGLDVRASRPADAEVAAAHQVLSTPPDGRFTRTLVVLRRDDKGEEGLRGIGYQRTGGGLAELGDRRGLPGPGRAGHHEPGPAVMGEAVHPDQVPALGDDPPDDRGLDHDQPGVVLQPFLVVLGSLAVFEREPVLLGEQGRD